MIDEKDLLRRAYQHAAEYATDPSTQNGALIVNDNGDILARGANHFPKMVQEKPERWERPGKYLYVEHAERNAIYWAASEGVSTKRKIMICPWFACADCARGIIQARIKLVIGHQSPNDWTPDHWKESIKVAWDMLKEAGVELKWYEGKIADDDSIAIRFNGGIAHP